MSNFTESEINSDEVPQPLPTTQAQFLDYELTTPLANIRYIEQLRTQSAFITVLHDAGLQRIICAKLAAFAGRSLNTLRELDASETALDKKNDELLDQAEKNEDEIKNLGTKVLELQQALVIEKTHHLEQQQETERQAKKARAAAAEITALQQTHEASIRTVEGDYQRQIGDLQQQLEKERRATLLAQQETTLHDRGPWQKGQPDSALDEHCNTILETAQLLLLDPNLFPSIWKENTGTELSKEETEAWGRTISPF